MEHPITLIYLFDEETLGQLHRDWPSGVQVALCLDEEGGGNVVLLGAEEVRDAATHLSGVLGRDDADFIFVPKFGGYPTRRISFGDEQQFCGMVAEIADLPVRARATLASSEDGEPTEAAGPGPEQQEAAAASFDPVAPAVPDPETDAGHRAQRSPSAASRLPTGFLNPQPEEDPGPKPMKARISVVGGRARMTIAGARFLERFGKVCLAAEAGVSRDLKICIVPTDDPRWAPKPGASIEFPVEALTAVSRGARAEGQMAASVIVEDGRLIASIDSVGLAPVRTRTLRWPGVLRMALLGPASAAIVAFAMFQVGVSDEALKHMREAAQSVSYQGLPAGS